MKRYLKINQVCILTGYMAIQSPAFADRSTFKTASGQATIAFSNSQDGRGYITVNEKSLQLKSKIDGKTYIGGYAGIRFKGTPFSYGSSASTVVSRGPDVLAQCGGGGSETNPTDCTYTENRTSRISVNKTLVKDGLDYLSIHLDKLDRNFEIPACGSGLSLAATGDSLKSDHDVVSQIQSINPPLNVVALKHNLNARDAALANFESLPKEQYRYNGEDSLRVIFEENDSAYEFVRKPYGIEVFFIENLTGQSGVTYALLTGILPTELELSKVQVGLAYATDPFDPDAQLYRDYEYIQIELKGKTYLLNTVYSFESNFAIQSTLANVRFRPYRKTENSEKVSSNVVLMDQDRNDIQSHQCYAHALIR